MEPSCGGIAVDVQHHPATGQVAGALLTVDAWKCVLRHRLAAKMFLDLYGAAWFGPEEAFCSTSIGHMERNLSTFLEAVGSYLLGLEPSTEHSGTFYVWLRDLTCMEDRCDQPWPFFARVFGYHGAEEDMLTRLYVWNTLATADDMLAGAQQTWQQVFRYRFPGLFPLAQDRRLASILIQKEFWSTSQLRALCFWFDILTLETMCRVVQSEDCLQWVGTMMHRVQRRVTAEVVGPFD